MMNKIGVQTFTVRKNLKTPKELEKTLIQLIEMGYLNFELARINFNDDELKVLKKLQEDFGIVYSTCQIKLNKIESDFDYLMHFLEALRINTIEVSVIPIKSFLGKKKGLIQLAERLNNLGQKTKNYGVSLLYHHHNFELIDLDGVLGLEFLISKLNQSDVSLVVDTYWLARSGINPATFIDKHINVITGIHLRDCKMEYKKFKFKFQDTFLGNGTIDFNAIFNLNLKSVEFFSVEQETNTPFLDLEKSLNYIKRIQN